MSTSQQLAAFNYNVPSPLVWNPVKTANFTAVAGNAYPTNTSSSSITATLPLSPKAGDTVQFVDYAGTWSTNNVTVNSNGKKINSNLTTYGLASNRGTASFVYVDETQGWIISAGYFPLINLSPYTVTYLIVAGGGSGGSDAAGGGGAGGYQTSTSSLTPNTVYSIVVGAGGSSSSGGNSTFNSITSNGGGRGGVGSGNGTSGDRKSTRLNSSHT